MNRSHRTCEICGRNEILTPAAGIRGRCNYPPRMGHSGIISERLSPGNFRRRRRSGGF